MQRLIIRHGQTNANRLTRAAFGKSGAPLNATGIAQVADLIKELKKFDVDLSLESVAVSELLRAKQTAELAGFLSIQVSSLLNEVYSLDPRNTNELIANKIIPEEAKKAAKDLLLNPPKEKIWITHGLLITAVQCELGIIDPKNFLPNFCEIRLIEL